MSVFAPLARVKVYQWHLLPVWATDAIRLIRLIRRLNWGVDAIRVIRSFELGVRQPPDNSDCSVVLQAKRMPTKV